MPNFEKTPLNWFETKQTVYKLKRDGKCQFDEFRNEVMKDKNLEPELGTLTSIIQYVANNRSPHLPKKKFRKLNTVKLPAAIYEAKSKHLRLYLIMDNGIIFLCGGYKVNQDSNDINNAVRIVKELYEKK